MSEFKGTKGKWKARISSIGIDVITNNDKAFGIVDFGNFKELDLADYPKEEALYNALLISKAPEMLDMLKEILISVENSDIPADVISMEKLEQLIKQATEL